MDYLIKLIKNKRKYDLILIDADKENYISYFDKSLKLLIAAGSVTEIFAPFSSKFFTISIDGASLISSVLGLKDKPQIAKFKPFRDLK